MDIIRNRLAKILDNQDDAVAANPHAKFRRELSFNEVYLAYKAANGKCQICKAERGARNLALDHDHKTMRVRGVLCTNCNVALGMMDDDIERLRSAIAYLSQS